MHGLFAIAFATHLANGTVPPVFPLIKVVYVFILYHALAKMSSIYFLCCKIVDIIIMIHSPEHDYNKTILKHFTIPDFLNPLMMISG